MSHFTESLYLKRQIQTLINEQMLLKTKLRYLLESQAPPTTPKGGISPSTNPANTVLGHVFTPPSLSDSPYVGQAERWINYVFNNVVNLQSVCAGASNCIWDNPNVQREFAEALLRWLDANNINQAQMLEHLSRWEAYTNMLNMVNNLSPGAAQQFFQNHQQWAPLFEEMNSPAFQNALTGYLNNMNDFLDLLNKFKEVLASGGSIGPDNLFYEFNLRANVLALGQLDNYIAALQSQIDIFKGWAVRVSPDDLNYRLTLDSVFKKISKIFDSIARVSETSFVPSQLSDLLEALMNNDMKRATEIINRNPWLHPIGRAFANLSDAEKQRLVGELASARTSRDLYMALAVTLGIAVAAYIISYIIQWFSDNPQDSGVYSPAP